MRRTLLAAVLLVGTVVAFPAAGFLTARNAIVPCGIGASDFQGQWPVAVTNPGDTFEARIATWNAEAANSTFAVIAVIRRIGADADVISVQGLHSEGRHTVERAFGDWWGISKADNALQILWRKSRYTELAESSEKVFAGPIEYGVASGSTELKSIQWVQLRDKTTGAVILVANHHIVPSIDKNGRPDHDAPKRLALADRQLTAMTGLIGALRAYGPVFTTGDLNVDERMDARVRDASFPFVRMGAAGMVSNWEALRYPDGGTHGGSRLIDSVWATAATTHFIDQQILSTSGSDHNAVLAVARNGSGAVPVAAAAAVFAAAPAAQVINAGQSDSLTVPGPTPQSTMELKDEQVAIASSIIRIGKANGIPEEGWIVALATALQESRLRNLDYGDRDSVGVFQQRPSTGWGTPAQILDIDLSVKAFYGIADQTHNPGLTDINGWRAMTVAQAAQAVQQSAFPDAYAQWEKAARSIVQLLSGSVPKSTACGAATSTTSNPGLSGELFVRAKSWIDAKVPYSQSRYYTNQYGTYREDCSGFVSMALGLDTSLTTVTLPQVMHPITKDDLRPGDFMLNTAPGNAGHVAIFAGWTDATQTHYKSWEANAAHGASAQVVPFPYWAAWSGVNSYRPYRRG